MIFGKVSSPNQQVYLVAEDQKVQLKFLPISKWSRSRSTSQLNFRIADGLPEIVTGGAPKH